MSAPEPTAGASGSPLPTTAKARLVTFAKWGIMALAVGLLVRALILNWDDVAVALRDVGWGAFVAATVAASAALWCNTLSWRAVMKSVGLAAPLPDASSVFLVSQAGKYVPGAVWPVLAQAEFARDHGVSRPRALTGSLVAMVVGVTTAGVVGVLGLLIAAPEAIADYWWAIAVAVGLIAMLLPPVLRRIIAMALRVTKRGDGTVPEIGAKALGVSATWSVLNWLFLGAQAWLLLRPLAPDAASAFALATGAFAVSWLVGFIVVIAPAGLGAREAALVVTLSSVATGPQALAVALLSRFAMSLADGVGLLVGLAIRASRARKAQVGKP